MHATISARRSPQRIILLRGNRFTTKFRRTLSAFPPGRGRWPEGSDEGERMVRNRFMEPTALQRSIPTRSPSSVTKGDSFPAKGGSLILVQL